MSLILIIDNDIDNIEFLETCLHLFNFETISSLSGEEGFELAIEHQPDAILTDLIMPTETWDGYQTITQLKSYSETQHIVIIAVTAIGDLNRALNAGCDNYLLRPFRLKLLEDMINRYLTQQQ